MIKGNILRDAIISGANNIQNHRQRVDALNVFPVPDGDTGTNMGMTMDAAKAELTHLDDSTNVGDVARAASSALLRGARGNSGVITSLLFRGFANGLKGKEEASAGDLANALDLGVKAAYKAVMKPTEGTMLTVARVAGEKALELDDTNMTVLEMWDQIIQFAQETLDQTPEMLPVLKKAGVVDAGGEGVLCIFHGMRSVFAGQGIISNNAGDVVEVDTIHLDEEFDELDGEIEFGYCTEFIIILDTEAESKKDPLDLRNYLEGVGDSVVVVDDEEIIKCHVHTNDPGLAVQKALEYGELTKLKVDNMRLQYAEKLKEREAKKAKKLAKVDVDPDQPFGFVAVSAGAGIEQLFTDLGVTHVVSGGQTMNPSTEDILSAIEATPSQTVFVLPNNKNIIMASEQAAKISSRTVKVIPTRTIPQGLGAMLAFDDGNDADENAIAMRSAGENVGTGQITYAARDSDFDGHKIKEGELLALENGKVAFVDTDLTKCAVKLTKNLIKKDSSFVTVIYGSDVETSKAEIIEAAIKEKLPKDVDVALIKGDQPVYYLIISVE